MDISNVSSETLDAYSSDKKQEKIQAINFKNLFIYITNELKNLGLQLADNSTTSITIRGIKFDNKNSTGALFYLQQYSNELQNINSFASDIMSKTAALDEQASKMIGG